MKAKRTNKTKTQVPTRRKSKKASPKSKPAKKAVKNKRTVGRTVPASFASGEPTGETSNLSAFSALNDVEALADAWDILSDEEFLLDESVWANLYSKIKLQLLRASHSFRSISDGETLTPYAVTAMPAFRGDYEPGYLNVGQYTLIKPEFPGIVFDLKISANDVALLMDWQLKRKDAAKCSGHMALYIDGELVEAANLVESRAHLDLTRDDAGAVSFYFLDADTGRQIKVLDLEL